MSYPATAMTEEEKRLTAWLLREYGLGLVNCKRGSQKERGRVNLNAHFSISLATEAIPL